MDNQGGLNRRFPRYRPTLARSRGRPLERMEDEMIDHEKMGSFVSGAAFAALLLAGTWPTVAVADHASFKDEISLIFQEHCVECHQPGGDGYEKSGLDLTSYEGVMKGTNFGPVVVPGDAFTSNLLVLIEGRADKRIKMPHGGRKDLTKWQKVMIRRWVNRGAKDN